MNLEAKVSLYLEILILARNRNWKMNTPSQQLASEIIGCIKQYPADSERDDFIFYFVVFYYHKMLPPHVSGRKYYGTWYRKYRQQIANALNIDLDDKFWSNFMNVMKALPNTLRRVKTYCWSEISANVASAHSTSDASIHTAYYTVWCALHYHYVHWETFERLQVLMMYIKTQGIACDYSCPLFTGASLVERLVIGAQLPTTTTRKKKDFSHSLNKQFEDMDFVAGCDGCGAHWFHLQAFDDATPLYKPVPNPKPGSKRPRDANECTDVPSKRQRVEEPDSPRINPMEEDRLKELEEKQKQLEEKQQQIKSLEMKLKASEDELSRIERSFKNELQEAQRQLHDKSRAVEILSRQIQEENGNAEQHARTQARYEQRITLLLETQKSLASELDKATVRVGELEAELRNTGIMNQHMGLDSSFLVSNLLLFSPHRTDSPNASTAADSSGSTAKNTPADPTPTKKAPKDLDKDGMTELLSNHHATFADDFVWWLLPRETQKLRDLLLTHISWVSLITIRL